MEIAESTEPDGTADIGKSIMGTEHTKQQATKAQTETNTDLNTTSTASIERNYCTKLNEIIAQQKACEAKKTNIIRSTRGEREDMDVEKKHEALPQSVSDSKRWEIEK